MTSSGRLLQTTRNRAGHKTENHGGGGAIPVLGTTQSTPVRSLEAAGGWGLARPHGLGPHRGLRGMWRRHKGRAWRDPGDDRGWSASRRTKGDRKSPTGRQCFWGGSGMGNRAGAGEPPLNQLSHFPCREPSRHAPGDHGRGGSLQPRARGSRAAAAWSEMIRMAKTLPLEGIWSSSIEWSSRVRCVGHAHMQRIMRTSPCRKQPLSKLTSPTRSCWSCIFHYLQLPGKKSSSTHVKPQGSPAFRCARFNSGSRAEPCGRSRSAGDTGSSSTR